jgi:hypothetical protein
MNSPQHSRSEQTSASASDIGADELHSDWESTFDVVLVDSMWPVCHWDQLESPNHRGTRSLQMVIASCRLTSLYGANDSSANHAAVDCTACNHKTTVTVTGTMAEPCLSSFGHGISKFWEVCKSRLH